MSFFEESAMRVRLLLFTVVVLLHVRIVVLAADLVPMKYNNPGLVVDLGVGLWAWPLPMDYDSDGDTDMVVCCPDVPYNGTYLFENTGVESTSTHMTVFKPAVRIGPGLENLQVCYIEGVPRVLAPGKEFMSFREHQFGRPQPLLLPADFHKGKIRANQWKYFDYDGDGLQDLIVGIEDWAEYGWDNAFDANGNWTNGPLHGYVNWAKNIGTATEPRYDKPEKILANHRVVDVYGMPSPNFADFDGDGDFDLICGEFIDKFTYFENVGTRNDPKYAAGRFIMQGETPLRVHLCMTVPVTIDWDRDGYTDLVVGQEDGRVMLIRNSGSLHDGVPQFERPQFFQQEADLLKFGALATPVGVDWDGDGDEDIISGNSAGEIGFIENLDGGCPPRWAPPQLLRANGKEIRIQAGRNGSIQGPCEEKWGYTTLSAADWNRDGLKDLIVNSILGQVAWYQNIGGPKQPELAAAQPIEVEWQGNTPKPEWVWWEPHGKQLVTQWRTTPIARDLDNDGLMDLVMLDTQGYLSWFKRGDTGDALYLSPPQRVFVDESGQPFRLTEGSAGASGRRKIHLADWDGDGLADVLVTSENVQFIKASDWVDGQLHVAGLGNVAQRVLAGHDTSPTTVDWNYDGKPDLLIGAEDGHFYYLQNPHTLDAPRNE